MVDKYRIASWCLKEEVEDILRAAMIDLNNFLGFKEYFISPLSIVCNLDINFLWTMHDWSKNLLELARNTSNVSTSSVSESPKDRWICRLKNKMTLGNCTLGFLPEILNLDFKMR